MSCSRLLVTGGLGSPAGRFSPPCIVVTYNRPRCLPCGRTGDSICGYLLWPEPGAGGWWRYDFDVDVRARLRATVRDRDDLSINGLELVGHGRNGVDVRRAVEHAA